MSAVRGVVPAIVIVIAVVAALWPRPSDAAGVVNHDYVGAQRCKSCHAAEFAAWEKSPHARAFDVLDADAKKSVRCLTCHTLVTDDTQLGLTGVQCESCHGAGRHYTPDYVMRDQELSALLGLVAKVDERACLRCHTDASPTLGAWNWQSKRELIKHWKD